MLAKTLNECGGICSPQRDGKAYVHAPVIANTMHRYISTGGKKEGATLEREGKVGGRKRK